MKKILKKKNFFKKKILTKFIKGVVGKVGNVGKEGMGDICIKCDKEDKGENRVAKLVQESHL